MELYSYLLSVRAARSDAEWARLRLQELAEGVPLPSMDFQPHGRSGGVSDRTAAMAISRIRRREYATEKLETALRTLNEFRGIIQDADLNEQAAAALWAVWGMGMTRREAGKRLGMSTLQASGLVREAETVIRPAVEKL